MSRTQWRTQAHSGLVAQHTSSFQPPRQPRSGRHGSWSCQTHHEHDVRPISGIISGSSIDPPKIKVDRMILKLRIFVSPPRKAAVTAGWMRQVGRAGRAFARRCCWGPKQPTDRQEGAWPVSPLCSAVVPIFLTNRCPVLWCCCRDANQCVQKQRDQRDVSRAPLSAPGSTSTSTSTTTMMMPAMWAAYPRGGEGGEHSHAGAVARRSSAPPIIRTWTGPGAAWCLSFAHPSQFPTASLQT